MMNCVFLQKKGGKADARVAVDGQTTFTTILNVSNNLKIALRFFKLSPHAPPFVENL